jgi:serine/threonine-protein kinase
VVYRPGAVIAGKYELIRVISQGGMGSVWMAHHQTLQIETAIKLIRPGLRAETLTERFINEARVAASVEHPGIVSIFDLGVTERGDPFIVMELLKGEDLRELLRRALRLDPVRAVQLLLPIADALATAHARGIVHRDLKPENVFVVGFEQRIQPKIVDFGIAKPSWACERRLTRTGTVMGSPEYMSPEQAQGREDVDQRVDVWSFCIVLYECLVGRTPFAGSYDSTLNDILEKPVLPITVLGIDEPELWAILERGLAKHREQRWPDMRSLGKALAEWLLGRGVDEDVCAHSLRATWLRHAAPGPAGREAANSVSSSSQLAALQEAVTLQVPAPAAPVPAPKPSRRPRGRMPARRAVSLRMLVIALTLFGVGCAGGSAWLGSALGLPAPLEVSGQGVAAVRRLAERLTPNAAD